MNNRRVLIVDDDPKFRNVIKRALRASGYVFFEVESVDEGVSNLHDSRSPTVVLLDLVLRDAHGEDFLERFKADQIHRVIILTAHDEFLTAERATEWRVFAYLSKATRLNEALRFTVEQAFKDIEREQLQEKTDTLIAVQQRINTDIQRAGVENYASQGLTNLLKLICQSVMRLIRAYSCHIRLYNLNRGEFDLVAFAGPSDHVRRLFEEPRRLGESFSGKAANSKMPIVSEDLQSESEFMHFKDHSLKNPLLNKDAREYLNSVQSAFIVPITTGIFGDEVDAVLNVSSDIINFFDHDKQEVVKEFVAQARFAITTAWQKQRQEYSHQEYRFISNLLGDISKELRGHDIERQILEVALQGLSQLLKPEVISVYLIDKAKRLLINEAEVSHRDLVTTRMEGHRPSEGLMGLVFEVGQTIRIPNLQQRDKRKVTDLDPLMHERIKTVASGRIAHYLGVPLKIGNEVIGMIQLINKKSDYYLNPKISNQYWLLDRGFSEDEESMLLIAASHLAVTIRSARLLEERNRQISKLETLKEVGRYTTAEMPLNELLERIIEEAARNVKAEICLLFMLDENDRVIVFEQSYGIPKEVLNGARYEIGEGLSGTVAYTGESRLIGKADLSGKYDGQILQYLNKIGQQDRTIESLMVVPIRTKGKTLGVIKAINKKGLDQQYNLEDLSFFETFANYVAIAIENAQRYELASRRLATAESTSMLSNLVASVGHEINNTYGLIPYNVIELRKILANINAPNANEILDEIDTLARQMVFFSNEIAGYSIGKMGQLRSVEVNEVVKSAVSQVPDFKKPRNFANIKMILQLAESPIMCDAYETALIQTIRNMVINAYQALEGKETGEIVITTSEDQRNGTALIEIIDNGCGIEEHYKSRIFDPNFTTKPGYGSGLGLWLAKRQMDYIGGSIVFESSKKRGTKFRLSLPLIHRNAVIPTE